MQTRKRSFSYTVAVLISPTESCNKIVYLYTPGCNIIRFRLYKFKSNSKHE